MKGSGIIQDQRHRWRGDDVPHQVWLPQRAQERLLRHAQHPASDVPANTLRAAGNTGSVRAGPSPAAWRTAQRLCCGIWTGDDLMRAQTRRTCSHAVRPARVRQQFFQRWKTADGSSPTASCPWICAGSPACPASASERGHRPCWWRCSRQCQGPEQSFARCRSPGPTGRSVWLGCRWGNAWLSDQIVDQHRVRARNCAMRPVSKSQSRLVSLPWLPLTGPAMATQTASGMGLPISDRNAPSGSSKL